MPKLLCLPAACVPADPTFPYGDITKIALLSLTDNYLIEIMISNNNKMELNGNISYKIPLTKTMLKNI